MQAIYKEQQCIPSLKLLYSSQSRLLIDTGAMAPSPAV